VTGDTDALKPFTRTSRANRSAFSRLANTPNCTAQPDSEVDAAADVAWWDLAGFSTAAAARAGFGAADRGAAADGGGVGFCAGVVDFAVRCAGALASLGRTAASPGRAACAPDACLGACDVPDDCGALDDCGFDACELAVGELAACGVPDVCDAPLDCDLDGCELAAGELAGCGVLDAGVLVVGEPAAGDSLCALDESGVAGRAAPGCTVGCSGPLGCGIAGPLLPAASVGECESSPKLIVYDLNGGSSDELGAVPAGTGAEGPFGPDNSSGTNNTISTTRMIAPVSRSFTRSSTVGTKPPQSSVRQPTSFSSSVKQAPCARAAARSPSLLGVPVGPPVRHMCRT
jgi:hypothetical protein